MPADKFVIVKTKYGPVKGDHRSTLLGMDYINFQGIPYMKAPLSNLRFKSPVEPENWSELFDATQACPAFPQYDNLGKRFFGIEDGGRVNVFTKSVNPNKLYPVLVYIHGGGFQIGSSQPDLMYGPGYLLQKEVLVVSINYRVGALGFLSLDDESLNVPGNAGLKDQCLALKWVKNNIKNFGGDPDNVTLFGTSAGGSSVHYHLISPQSKGLFNRAIAMSGSAINTSWALHPRRNYAERIAKICGFEGNANEKNILEFLENAELEKIFEAAENILTDEEIYDEHIIFSMGPVIEPYMTDDTFVDKSPILMARDAWSKDIDVIFGATSNEGLLMCFFPHIQEKGIIRMQDSRNFTPFLDLNIQKDDPMAEKFGKKLKEVYYGSSSPSSENILGYYYFQGDLQFWHGIQRSILSRVNSNGKGKTFTYRFDILTKMNVFRKLFGIDKFEGTEHGACSAYILNGLFIPQPGIDSVEFKNIKKVVDLITNFAIYGETNIPEWEENKSTKLPLKCYNLTKDEDTFIDLPETNRLQVWDEIYNEAGVELY